MPAQAAYSPVMQQLLSTQRQSQNAIVPQGGNLSLSRGNSL